MLTACKGVGRATTRLHKSIPRVYSLATQLLCVAVLLGAAAPVTAKSSPGSSASSISSDPAFQDLKAQVCGSHAHKLGWLGANECRRWTLCHACMRLAHDNCSGSHALPELCTTSSHGKLHGSIHDTASATAPLHALLTRPLACYPQLSPCWTCTPHLADHLIPHPSRTAGHPHGSCSSRPHQLA